LLTIRFARDLKFPKIGNPNLDFVTFFQGKRLTENRGQADSKAIAPSSNLHKA
jgi:hypothetical protein